MARREYSDETKAQVMAALLAGQSINEVATRHKIPAGTVKSWRRNRREFRPVDTQKGAEIGDLLLEYRENLITLRAQVEHFRDPKWLSSRMQVNWRSSRRRHRQGHSPSRSVRQWRT